MDQLCPGLTDWIGACARAEAGVMRVGRVWEWAAWFLGLSEQYLVSELLEDERA